jgi:REP element-mobilizing transposase RayT
MERKLYKNKYRTDSLRLSWWDYSENGDYFITIRASRKGNIFGEINKKDVELNARGGIVKEYLMEIPDHFDNIILRTWVVMPDHVHFILRIHNKRTMVETQHSCVSNDNDLHHREYDQTDQNNFKDDKESNFYNTETQRCCVSTKDQRTNDNSSTFYKLKPKSIPVIVRSFKSACTRKIHVMENNKNFKWQKSYYDKVIFNDQVLHEIESYIRTNPQNHHPKQNPHSNERGKY